MQSKLSDQERIKLGLNNKKSIWNIPELFGY